MIMAVPDEETAGKPERRMWTLNQAFEQWRTWRRNKKK
jgi:hypothetical protein